MAVPLIAPSSEFQALLDGTPLEDCFRFWRTRSVGGMVPRKASLDPVEMPLRILPFLFIYEQVEGRFRCRLAGTGLCAAFQSDPTGRYLDDMILPTVKSHRVHLFERVVERSLPVVYSGYVAEPGRTWIKFRRLLLPIAIKGTEPDGVFGMVIFPEFELRKSSPKLVEDSMPDQEAWATADDLV
jgi:hypothetical protein